MAVRNGFNKVNKILLIFIIDLNDTTYKTAPYVIFGIKVVEDDDDFIAYRVIPDVIVNSGDALAMVVLGVIKIGDEGVEFLNL
ncbi:hypothetical protein AGMMS50222_10070 [Endomicrobiia bacterium]|nr:hypothetical protein AGMMS50222_10070 [Endomicrobiia bacterium]